MTKPLEFMTDPELRAFMATLARALEARLPAGSASSGRAVFAIVLTNDRGESSYVSNAPRHEMAVNLKNVLATMAGVLPPAVAEAAPLN